jgi:hypothetical protein
VPIWRLSSTLLLWRPLLQRILILRLGRYLIIEVWRALFHRFIGGGRILSTAVELKRYTV